MRFRSGMKVIIGAAALVLLAQAPLNAQTLFYNGSANSVTGLSSEKNGIVDQSMVFDDFVVTGAGWNITGLFGDFLSDLTWNSAAYEIRSGVSAGNGGSLLFSGTAAATRTDLGVNIVGYEEYRAAINGLSIFLTPGTYWMGITIVSPGVTGRAFLASTSGAGGVNADHDGISFFNSNFFGVNFGSAADQTGTPTDFSYGILGADGSPTDAAVTPEPATMTLLATGLIGLAGVPLRKRRRS